MAEGAVIAANLVNVSLLWLLAAWILYLRLQSLVHRALALVLFVRGLHLFLNLMVTLQQPLVDPFWPNVRGYVSLGLMPALVYFFLAYNWRRPSRPLRLARRLVIGAWILLELAYLFDHSLLFHLTAEGRVAHGPLGVLASGLPLVAALIALYFAAAASRSESIAQQRFHRLLSVAFACLAMVEGSGSWNTLLRNGKIDAFYMGEPASFGGTAVAYAQLAGVVLALVAAVRVIAQLVGGEAGTARIMLLSGLVVAAAGMPLVAFAQDTSPRQVVFLVFLGAARLIFPLLVAYAVARQVADRREPLKLDVKVHVSLQRGTVGALLISSFFVIGEGAEAVFSRLPAVADAGENVSNLIGILGAGVLIFFLHPLQRLGERLARSALPRGRPIGELSGEDRRRLYAEQAAISWMDGSLSVKERQILDSLRDHLGLSVEDAAGMESEAARSAGVLVPRARKPRRGIVRGTSSSATK